MTELQKIAIEKLENESKAKMPGNKEKAMAKFVCEKLINFCQQSEIFAEAVHDCNSSFSKCMAEVAKGVGNSISDFEAYSKAVKFYLPTAKINVVMEVVTNNTSATAVKQSNKKVSLNLLDLM